MESIISEGLWESSLKVFNQKDTISSILCVPGLIFLKCINFIKEKGKSLKTIKFYGHENRMTLFQLRCMKPALYGIDIKHMKKIKIPIGGMDSFLID